MMPPISMWSTNNRKGWMAQAIQPHYFKKGALPKPYGSDSAGYRQRDATSPTKRR